MNTLVVHIDAAYHWLCQQRRCYPPDADVWHLRFHWHQERQRIFDELLSGEFSFSPQSIVQKTNGDMIHLWTARDALVLKMMAIALGGILPISTQCTHVKGHGGLKATVKAINRQIPQYQFVIRTDVKGYYANIDHSQLMNQLADTVKDRTLLRLLWQYMRRSVIIERFCAGYHEDVH